jgi:SAM-dependent methyltransferase
VVARERGRVFGERADAYEDARPGYPAALVEEVLAYAGTPRRIVEVGAGTGKATVTFAATGVPIYCIEPDPRMATVLRARMADHAGAEVVVSRFEDWQPPSGGVDLLYSAQAWHWVDSQRRWRLAAAALAPGGAMAIFGHSYQAVDPAVGAAMWDLQTRLIPDSSRFTPQPRDVDPYQAWFSVELADCGLFVDVRAGVFHTVVSYPKTRYLALVQTFSAYRMLPPALRREVRLALGRLLDECGGVIEIDLATVLALGRRQGFA